MKARGLCNTEYLNACLKHLLSSSGSNRAVTQAFTRAKPSFIGARKFSNSARLNAVISSPHDALDIPKINLLHYLMDDFARFSNKVALVSF